MIVSNYIIVYIFCAIFWDGKSQPLPTGLDLFLGHTSWPGCPVVVAAWLRGYAGMPGRHRFCIFLYT